MNSKKLKYLKRNRLLIKSQYDCVFNEGFRKNSPKWTFFIKNNNNECARLGIIITKKNYKRANVRNRIKRIIRESFRNNQYDIGGLDVIVIAKPGIDHLKTKLIRNDLDNQWKILKSGQKTP